MQMTDDYFKSDTECDKLMWFYDMDSESLTEKVLTFEEGHKTGQILEISVAITLCT